ncbi:hypothetical protein PanWU01x14_215620 [Parasponia andersonii]|uniref:Uncharacterized protein n=1 Tax=Parasponia andersonii TaxID=3476 RepID=A0A2P5BRU3_PARAD|nr:hypothetical protein PanWU01x14_215620 [Parasponia andersonii]
MALLSNIFSCFSESSDSPESKRYICNGDVCVLRKPKGNVMKTSKHKRKQSFGISLNLLSMKRSQSL